MNQTEEDSCEFFRNCTMLAVKDHVGKGKIISLKKLPPVVIDFGTSCDSH